MSLWSDDFYKRGKVSKEKRVRAGRDGWMNSGASWVLPSFMTLILVALVGILIAPLLVGSGEKAAPAFATGDPLDLERQKVQAINKVKSAVVSVLNYPQPRDGGQGTSTEMYGLGSGVIFQVVKGKAFVVTNHHVIDGGAEFEVVLTTGERRVAKLVGSDLFTDLAVLSVDEAGIDTVAVFGDSDKLEAGESVIAIGNPLGISYSQTLTGGIISSLRTPVPISLTQSGQVDWEFELIQTDAAINRGNSGGALVNMNGEVIGINNMKVADFGVEGLGFAIPINEAADVLRDLLQYGKVKRPFIGVSMQDLALSKEERAMLELPDDVFRAIGVTSAGGPAAEAGLKIGDVIVRLDGRVIDSSLALRKYLYNEKAIGDVLRITFYREGKLMSVEIELSEREER